MFVRKTALTNRRRLAWALCAVLANSTAALGGQSGYHLLRTVTLGGSGGWDQINLDPASGNLFITRGTHVMVVDPDTGKLIADIVGLQGIHDTAFTDGRAYITEGGSNKVAVLDTKSFSRLSEISVGRSPDGILYDPASEDVFTFNGSDDATAVDPASGNVIGTVLLGGKPEAGASDGKGTIFVNIQDKNELVAFDAMSLVVKAHYPLASCESPSGIAADIAHWLIFSGCANGVTVATEMYGGKSVASIPIGRGVDANRYDPGMKLVFSSNGESGTLTIAREVNPLKFRVLENIATAPGARTMEQDPKTQRVFLVTADQRPGTPTSEQPHPRPVPVPGTFRLLIFGL